MRKNINFDIDTNMYTKITGKAAPTAYYELRKFLENNDFLHRQGSGYISKYPMKSYEISDMVTKMSQELPWLKPCVKEFDVTNVGKQFSLIQTIKDAPEVEKEIEENNELDEEPDITDDF